MRPWLSLLLLLTVAPAHADGARAALDRFAHDLIGLEGTFQQRVYNVDGSLREQSDGSLALKAPRLFRWQYDRPYEQLVVADGSHVWLYDIDLEQVTVRRQADQEAQSPLVVLTDPDSLDQRYTVTELGQDGGLAWLRLEPIESESEFRYAELGLGEAGLERMRMEDSLGGRSEILFTDWQRNTELSDDRFRFVPPDGVDLIGDTDSLSEIRPLPEDGW